MLNRRALAVVCPECWAQTGRLCVDVVPSGAHPIRVQVACLAPRPRRRRNSGATLPMQKLLNRPEAKNG